MRYTVVALLFVFVGCTHYKYPFSVDELKAQGYQPQWLGGGQPQAVTYQVWWKETRDDGRRVHLCVVPGRSTGGYVWDAVVYVDSREAWTYSLGGGSSQPGNLQHGVSCATTDPLPEGKVTWRTLYKYWH